jgi:hypothetical protein
MFRWGKKDRESYFGGMILPAYLEVSVYVTTAYRPVTEIDPRFHHFHHTVHKVTMVPSRYDTCSSYPRRATVTSSETVSNLLEEFEMATLWVRSQHDVAKEKIFGFLQKWNDKGRKHMFQILGRFVSFPGVR